LKKAIAVFDTSTIKSVLSNYYTADYYISSNYTKRKAAKPVAKAKQIIELATRAHTDFRYKHAYEASVMLYARDIHKASVDFLLEKIDAGVEVIHQTTLSETFHYYGDSALCTLTFVAPDSAGVYKFTLKGTRNNKLNYAYDHFLLREKNELAIELDTTADRPRITRINNFNVQ
jgi:hypothetical protein